MVEFLVIQIKLGKLTLDKVPKKYREEVEKQLKQSNN